MNLHTNQERQQADLLAIIDRAIAAVSPDPAMRAALSLKNNRLTVDGRAYDLADYQRIQVLGAGKASAAMAQTLEAIFREAGYADRLTGGLVATKYDHGAELEKIQVMESGHPVPDAAGETASREILRIAEEAAASDLVFCLISGGASAIIPAPRPPATLSDKQETTRRLLECGATIHEINAIRKHLSQCKGGHLARALAPATVITLIISDVVGDNLDVIGSGPTAPDGSTFADCQTILEKYGLWDSIPPAARQVITEGASGDMDETCKAEEGCFDRVQNVIIAGNALALNGAARAAEELGYAPVMLDHPMQGEARETARHLLRKAEELRRNARPGDPPFCLLAGGETTVTIRGNGKGGRNQEMALAAAIALSEMPDLQKSASLACVGTDGTDGPTDAAGALVFPDTLIRAKEAGLSAAEYLNNNDAYHFFSRTGTILKTGPTRTNVMDLAVVLAADLAADLVDPSAGGNVP